MSATDDAKLLDREELRKLFDLRSSYNAHSGGGYTDDPYPVWRELREQAPVHEGIVHELTGFAGPAMFQGLPFPDRPHFSAFSFEACDAAFRDGELFASAPEADGTGGDGLALMNSMLSMGGTEHRRYRALVQPSFVPAKAQWWINNWIEQTVHALIDQFVDDGHAELNVDFAAAIPVLTITGSFGIPVEQALVVRGGGGAGNPMAMFELLGPIIASRREAPQDDLISVLVEAEYTDDDGVSHRLTDEEIYGFTFLLLAAGSGTTWKQLGITLAALLQRPEVLAAVRDDRSLLRPAIEESLRWMPTDPMFSRHVTRDVDFQGVQMPKERGDAPLPGGGQPRPGSMGAPGRVRHHATAEARARVRQRSARLSGHARGARGDVGRDQRPARPAAQLATRPRRRTPGVHRDVRAGRDLDPGRVRMSETA